MRTLLLGLGTLAIAACASTYVYRPAVTTTAATVDGRVASYYAIPPEAPRGDVRVVTMGFAQIEQRDTPNSAVQALHVRLVVANNSEAPWKLDTREQRAVLPKFGESSPAYAKTDSGTPPEVPIPPLTERTVDLYYPLPAGMQKASALPAFDVLWAVDTGTRKVVERTPFERLEVEPVEPYGGYAVFTEPDWYNPTYATGGVYGGSWGPVVVTRPVVLRQRIVVAPR
jgi:hypothetical protein